LQLGLQRIVVAHHLMMAKNHLMMESLQTMVNRRTMLILREIRRSRRTIFDVL
jgi:hypothetical protein